MEPAYFWQSARTQTSPHGLQSADLLKFKILENRDSPKPQSKDVTESRIARKVQPASLPGSGSTKEHVGEAGGGGRSFPNLTVIPPKWHQTFKTHICTSISRHMRAHTHAKDLCSRKNVSDSRSAGPHLSWEPRAPPPTARQPAS